jgi:Na+/H+-dicarboxylate symporter/ABC-type amino acid transport substrate-binding protein
MSLSTRIMLGLGLGIATGLFLGELVAPLKVVGDVFIRLLQMTVLPYVMVSLIAGLGRLDYHEAQRLGIWGGGILLLLWAMAFAMVALMPLAFPDLESASFFSTSLVEPAREVDFVELYVPSNFFYSLANNIVPAVVVFSLAVGIAMIGVEGKTQLLDSFDALSEAMLRVTSFVVSFTPFGVFAIAAAAAGTMSIEEFERVQVYVLTYVAFSLVTAFWLLPGLVSALTPLRHRDILGISRDCLLTAFATGSSFVVIPLLAEHSKELLRGAAIDHQDSESLVDVIVPASFSFPHSAKVLTLSFVVFAGWFSDTPVDVEDYPVLAFSGVASTFGSVNVAIPFLLDLMHLPHDLFQLFLATSVVNSRVGTLVQAVHVLTLTLLGTCALTGMLRFRLRPLLVYIGGTALVVVLVIVGARLLFSVSIDTTYAKDEVVRNMGLLLLDPVPSVVHWEEPPPRTLDDGQTRLEVVRTSRVLRVCYQLEGPPFTYRNASGALVGLDVEMVNSLARGLGVTPEFVPVPGTFASTGRIAERLNSGYCDIGVSGPAISMALLPKMAYSEPYLDLTIAFLVKDHRRKEFSLRDVIDANSKLRIAFPDEPYYLRRAAGFLPNAEIIPVADVDAFLAAEEGEFDAFVYAGEALGSVSLLNPEYAVVVPMPTFESVPAAYQLPQSEPEWRDLVNGWLTLKRGDGTIQKLFDYWVLGREAEAHQPRWSVARDVLHWIE